MQKSTQAVSVDPIAVHMEQRTLSKCRQSLMHTVNDQIRSALTAVLRKSFCQSQMRSVRFIHDQRNSLAMHDLRNLLYIRNPAFIGGRHQKYCIRHRFLRQCFRDLFRSYRIINIILLHHFRIQIRYC